MKLNRNIDIVAGEIIKECRLAADLTQMKLAAKIGVSYQQIQKYEKGLSSLSLPRLFQFAEALEILPCDFVDDIRLRLPYFKRRKKK
jgi:transcriptional regulator with XRE-family HTH domain